MNPGQLLIVWGSKEVEASKNVPRGAARNENPGAGAGRAQVKGCGGGSEFPRKVPFLAQLWSSVVLSPWNVGLLFIFLMPSVFLGRREGWDSLQAVASVFPWLRLRFRCSCAAPDTVLWCCQGWAGDSPDPDGSKGAGITPGEGWEGLGTTAASRGSGAVPEFLCCIPSVFHLY